MIVQKDSGNAHSPNHTVKKKLRICLDPRDLNDALEREPYYPRSVNEIIVFLPDISKDIQELVQKYMIYQSYAVQQPIIGAHTEVLHCPFNKFSIRRELSIIIDYGPHYSSKEFQEFLQNLMEKAGREGKPWITWITELLEYRKRGTRSSTRVPLTASRMINNIPSLSHSEAKSLEEEWRPESTAQRTSVPFNYNATRVQPASNSTQGSSPPEMPSPAPQEEISAPINDAAAAPQAIAAAQNAPSAPIAPIAPRRSARGQYRKRS